MDNRAEDLCVKTYYATKSFKIVQARYRSVG